MNDAFKAELQAVIAALRAHAQNSLDLAERISRLLQEPMTPSGLAQIPDTLSIDALMDEARAVFTTELTGRFTLTCNALAEQGIRTVGDLRERIRTYGRISPEFKRTPRYWKERPHLGSVTLLLLGKILERFGI